MTKILVSIVTWNSESDIDACLNSLFLQNYLNFEVVIFDNGSIDSTLEKIKIYSKYDNLKLVKNSSNVGFTGGHNYIINNFESDFVLLLNPDVQLHKSYLKNALNTFESNALIGSLSGLLLQNEKIIDCTGLSFTKSRRFLLKNNGKNITELNLKNEFVDGVDGAAAFYRRDAIDSIKINNNFLDEMFFAYSEDWDVAWRLKLAGWKSFFSKDCIGKHTRSFKQRNILQRSRISSIVKFHSLKNSIIMILKNQETKTLIYYLPFIAFRFLLVLGYSALFERESFKALKFIFNNRKAILEKRNAIQHLNKKRS